MRRAVWVLIVIAALLAVSHLVAAQARTPLATEADHALAALSISRDGNEVTFRGVASEALRVCVEPAAGRFGPRRCWTLGALRRGDLK